MSNIKKYYRKFKKPQYLQTYKRFEIFVLILGFNLLSLIIWLIFKFIVNKNDPTEFGIKLEVVSGVNTIVITFITIISFVLFLLKKKEEDERSNI
jgi:hypothetical protein